VRRRESRSSSTERIDELPENLCSGIATHTHDATVGELDLNGLRIALN
jgi:hypothetical protein